MLTRFDQVFSLSENYLREGETHDEYLVVEEYHRVIGKLWLSIANIMQSLEVRLLILFNEMRLLSKKIIHVKCGSGENKTQYRNTVGLYML